MEVILSKMHDEKNKIDKVLDSATLFEGNFTHESSVINPIITLEAINISDYNYLYIPQFGRYYYITDIVSVRTNLWRLSATADVLKTYAQEIKKCEVIISDSETVNNSYLQGRQWETEVKTKTDIYNFPSGLNTTGEYILITSGGVAGV